MIILRPLVAFFFVSVAFAKFGHLYDGIAADGLAACIDSGNFTRKSATLRENCRNVFMCVFDNIDSSQQTILSSGSAILGFVPTVLLLLGNTNEEIIRIHARFPLLAFLLSFSNINKGNERRERVGNLPVQNPPESSGTVCLGLYGTAGVIHPKSSFGTERTFSKIATYIVAAAGAAVVIWQTLDLGEKAVLSWACPTDFYPALWICTSVLHHVLAVVSLRLSLKPTNADNGRRSDCLLVTQLDLTAAGSHFAVANQRFASWSKGFVDLLGNVNYLYGTVIFSSLTLVSGNNAIKILVVYGIIAAVSRILCTWILQEMHG